MTVKELHIDLDVRLRKMNAQYFDNFSEEAFDWVLNIGQLRVMNNRLTAEPNEADKSLFRNQKRYDDLEELIDKETLLAYVHTAANGMYTQFCILPADYRHLVSDSSVVARDCRDVFANNVVTTAITNRYIAPITFEDSVTATPYSTFGLRVLHSTTGNIDIIKAADFPYLAAGIPDAEMKYEIVNLVLSEVRRLQKIDVLPLDFEIRWERYSDEVHTGKFVFDTTNPDYTRFYLDSNIVTTDVGMLTRPYQVYLHSLTPVEYPNRLTSIEHIKRLQRSSFHKSIYDSPLSGLGDGHIAVFHNSSFIIDSIIIEYIRQPRTISLSLNQTCELNEKLHNEVTAEAAAFVADLLNTPNAKNLRSIALTEE